MNSSNVKYIHTHETNIKTHGPDFEREVERERKEREGERESNIVTGERE